MPSGLEYWLFQKKIVFSLANLLLFNIEANTDFSVFSVDLEDWNTVEPSAAYLSSLPNLPQEVSAVARAKSNAKSGGGFSQRSS